MTLRGTEANSAWAVWKRELMPSISGKESTTQDRQLEEVVWRILIVALQSSLVNLFQISQQLEGLVGVILDRLFPPSAPIVPAHDSSAPGTAGAGFPGRPSIFVQPSSDERTSRLGSPTSTVQPGSVSGPLLAEALRRSQAQNAMSMREPVVEKAPDSHRPILLKVLKRLLEAGVPYGYGHRLFRLARRVPQPSIPSTPQGALSSTETPGAITPNGSPSGKKRPIKLKLSINTTLHTPPEQQAEGSCLDEEILEVLKHCMSKRWPDMFSFSARMSKAIPVDAGAVHDTEGGRIVSRDLGKAWPVANKGYTYMVRPCASHRETHLVADDGLVRPGSTSSRCAAQSRYYTSANRSEHYSAYDCSPIPRLE
jgi:hypothetical protein